MGVMDDTLLYNLITRWAEGGLYKSLGEDVHLPAAAKLSAAMQMSQSDERLNTSVSEKVSCRSPTIVQQCISMSGS